MLNALFQRYLALQKTKMAYALGGILSRGGCKEYSKTGALKIGLKTVEEAIDLYTEVRRLNALEDGFKITNIKLTRIRQMDLQFL